MSMRSVPMIGGRSWEFPHDGWYYRLISWNGTNYVHIERMLGSGNAGWFAVKSVPTDGLSANYIAAQIWQDITGRQE